jgi:hypothetical protein
MVQQQLTHHLNDKKHCCANVPLATCTAIHMGKFHWTSIYQPEAFSLLACYHLAATSRMAFQVSGEDAVSMHLHSMEGLGLNKADISKARALQQEMDEWLDHSHNKIRSDILDFAEFATSFRPTTHLFYRPQSPTLLGWLH